MQSLRLLLFPTLLGVLIYVFIRPGTIRAGKTPTVLGQILLLVGLFGLGLFSWAAAESAHTWATVQADFDSQFAPFLPAVLAEAVVIPLLDDGLLSRKRT